MKFKDLYEQVSEKLVGWAEGLFAMLPNLIVALAVVVAFWFLARAAQRMTDRALGRVGTHKAASSLMATLARVGVFVVGIVVALGVLNLDKALASILAGVGVVGLALGFAFQDLAANLISGVGLAVNARWPFQIGDIVETNDVLGTVEKIRLRTTHVRTFDGKVVIIPNKQVYQEKLINFSTSGERRIDIECGVSYGDDLERVVYVAKQALESVTPRDESRDAQVYFTGFGSSSIELVARFWIKYDEHVDFFAAQSQGVMALRRAFDEHDIMIPFPIRTLDFGIRGGETLAEVISQTPLGRTNGAGRAEHAHAD